MSLPSHLRILVLVLTLQPVAGLYACQFDPPGMSHEAWVKWVDDRNKANDEAARVKALGPLATNEKKAKAEKAENDGQVRTMRRSFGTTGGRRGSSVDNVVNLRR